MKYSGLVFGIWIYLSLVITIIVTISMLRPEDYAPYGDQQPDTIGLENVSLIHSNIFVSVRSFPKLTRLQNCSLHPDLLKMPMHLLLRKFDEVYNSSCVLYPPLLVSTLDFYVGSYSISLFRKRLHLTFIDCYPRTECYGSYQSVLNQQAFPIDLTQIYSRKSTSAVKSLFGRNRRRFACVFHWNDGQHVSKLEIVNAKTGGSGHCTLSDEILRMATRSKFSLKTLIVARHLHDAHILCKLYSNLFDLNIPLSDRSIFTKPFRISFACAPLTWAQIRTNIPLEWIIYHKLIGVGHFLIYIRETDTLNLQRIVNHLKPFIYSHTITLINWQFGAFEEPKNAFQIPQMIDAIQRTADYSVWTMVGDTDEFFYAEHCNTLTEILKSYQRIAEENLTITYRQELTIPNVHMMQSSKRMSNQFITGKYFSRYKVTPHPVRSKIIAYSGSDRFLTARDVHFSSEDGTFVPEQLIRLNHYYNAYDETRKPIEKIKYFQEDVSLWQRFGAKIQENFQDYMQKLEYLHISSPHNSITTI